MRNHFRRAILSSCQKEYEKKSDWSTLGDDSAKRMTDDMTTEELEEYTARENERRKMKRRALCM